LINKIHSKKETASIMIIKILTRVSFVLAFIGATSCTWDQISPQFDCTDSPVEIAITAQNDTSCGAVNGGFTINASGGQPPYTYNSEVGTNADGEYKNVAAGTYKVTATDAKGCANEVLVIIQNIDGVNINGVTTVDAGCKSSSGSIEVNASGGSSPYIFSLGNITQPSNVFTGLDRGSYTLKIRDQLGCEITQNVAISSGISYNNSIKGIIENSCAISGCHNGSTSPDLRTFSAIKSASNNIKSRTGNKSMPQGSSLTQSQIDMIACWVDDGALQN
jgi:hypothetical protein